MLRRMTHALIVCLAAAQLSGQSSQQSSERARLLGLQREAATLLTRAARPDASGDEVRRALLEASARFVAIAGTSTSAPPATAQGSPLAGPLREELGRAGRELAALGAVPAPRVNVAPFMALLERARVQLEGEVALGQSFQGSYSQTPAKEPVRGGHASSMGPAPAANAGDPTASPVCVRRSRAPSHTHLLRRPDERPHARIGRQRRGAPRLRRRRPARHLPRHRRRADTRARAHPAPQRALPQSRRLEVRGRVEAGRRRCRRLGQRRLRGRRRRRRPSRFLRHELGPELSVPQPRRRNVRGSRGTCRRGGRRLEHRLHVLRFGRRRRSRSLRRALRRHDVGRCRRRQADARLAQRPAHHGGTRRASRRGGSLLREPRQRPLRRRHGRTRSDRLRPLVRIRRRRDRLR